MATSTQVARAYFEALTAHDLDTAAACWQPGAVDRLVGQAELVAPDGIHEYFGALFAAFPDFKLEILSVTSTKDRSAVRWSATGTFVGPGYFQGFAPNGAEISIEGCDVLRVKDGLITGNDAYIDGADIARQLGILPAAGSRADTALTTLANIGTVVRRLLTGAEPEAIAPGVWLIRGGRPKTMNCYLIAEPDGGVTLFDAGVEGMAAAVRNAATRFGGLRRVVLGHADCDHRGSAAGLQAPVYCHALERSAAESPNPFRDYWDLRRLSRPAQAYFPTLLRSWDGGALQIAGTVEEGERIAGFKVVELPGHAPGLIGLFREEDRLALVSDCFYTLNPETGIGSAAHVPHPAFNYDTEQARDSIRKLAAMNVNVAWAGHAKPVSGSDVELQLQRAAATAV
jgi:glyoxylase-like metal-dependent hydrolase (beta-lactamase superfamily II)/predicted ester cyclase